MARYRKKPVVIEAVQVAHIVGPPQVPHPRWVTDGLSSGVLRIDIGGGLWVRTLEGSLEAGADDWIIQGVKGELYPCKPDVFAATYEWAEPCCDSTVPHVHGGPAEVIA